MSRNVTTIFAVLLKKRIYTVYFRLVEQLNLQLFWIWIPIKGSYRRSICGTWYIVWRIQWITNINPIFCPFFRTIASDAFACLVVEKTCFECCKYFLPKVRENWNLPKIFFNVIFSAPTPIFIWPKCISTPDKDKIWSISQNLNW